MNDERTAFRRDEARRTDATEGTAMSSGDQIIARAREALDLDSYRQQNWRGSFGEYLDLVQSNPRVTRTAFERIYDMILVRRDAGVHRQQEEDRPLQLLRRCAARRRRTPSTASTSR